MALVDSLGVKFYELVSGATGPCLNHSDDAPCTECLDGGVEAAENWLAKHSCGTCKWAEWRVKGPLGLVPIIGNPISPDVFAPMFEEYPVCRHEWAQDCFFLRGQTLPPDFGCTKYEAKP